MGYRSKVTIQCEEKAFELFEKAWKSVDFNPDSIWKSGSDGAPLYTFQWDWIKWYEDYTEVQAIKSVMAQLDNNFDDEAGYGYGWILIGEDNDTEYRFNDRGSDVCEDFYVIVDVNLPADKKRIN